RYTGRGIAQPFIVGRAHSDRRGDASEIAGFRAAARRVRIGLPPARSLQTFGPSPSVARVKDATASPHSKARQILVTFHDTLPRPPPPRGPIQPPMGPTVYPVTAHFSLCCVFQRRPPP